MTPVLAVLGAIFIVGVAIGMYAWFAPRRTVVAAGPGTQTAPPPVESRQESDWTSEAGSEFAGLSESARCDLVFAVADLNDERSGQLLVHALDDPAEAVALAAAHALAQRGSSAEIQAFLKRSPGPRADRIVQTLSLLGT